MEIPNKLKLLYKHWQYHTDLNLQSQDFTNLDRRLMEEMANFASERMKIWKKRNSKAQPPFTKDSILRKYRFCNIYRELDRQTIEIHSQLKDMEDEFSLWLLNIAFQRFVCRPETVLEVGHLNFSKKNNNKVYKKLMSLEKPTYGNAYVFPISVIQKSNYPTREKFFCFYLPGVIDDVSKIIQGFDNNTVENALKVVLKAFGYNFRFHWTEILIDVAYQFPDKIDLFKDFSIGPGALPIMKRLSLKADPLENCNSCVLYKINNFPYPKYNSKKILLSAENWEGIACEFRKYSNLKFGRGRVRIYNN